jgi:hypothetical protein
VFPGGKSAELDPNPKLIIKGPVRINFVVRVVTLLNWEKFLVHEEDVFVAVLSMPLEQTLYSCPAYLLQSRSKEVFF